MPLETEPKIKVPRNFVPPNSDEYKVKDGDNWEKIAKQQGMNASDLIYFNFKTNNPREVNWYLHNYVGCTLTTFDKLNWRFSSSANPGKIYLPKKVASPVRIHADELLISAVDEYDFANIAERFEKESSSGMNKWEVASSAQQIHSILNRYKHLKQINFYTHGNIGYVHFKDGGITSANAALHPAAPHNELFLGEGRVLFNGCNVGEGNVGRDFLVAVGHSILLRHGGFVGATTSTNFFGRLGIFDSRMPKWGDLRVIRFDATGKVIAEQLF